jgi:PncC family amidohydrolase
VGFFVAATVHSRMNHALDESARRVATELARYKLRVVFAESCTGGLIAATLAQNPGISEFLCGSAVVYRNATKMSWLGVRGSILDDPGTGPVSPQCAEAMARGALARTPEAQIALAIAGHLGPNAPVGLDGLVHIAIVHRSAAAQDGDDVVQHRLILAAHQGDPVDLRRERQSAAAQAALDRLYEHLASLAPL